MLKNRINSNSSIEVATDQVSPLSCDLINDTQDSDHVSSSCNAMNNPPTDHLDSRSTKQTSESSLQGRLSRGKKPVRDEQKMTAILWGLLIMTRPSPI